MKKWQADFQIAQKGEPESFQDDGNVIHHDLAAVTQVNTFVNIH